MSDAGRQAPADVLFAGLAPGLIGIYQVSIRMPADAQPFETDPTRSWIIIQCGSERNDRAGIPLLLRR